MITRTEEEARRRPYVDVCQYDSGSINDCTPMCGTPATHRLLYEVSCSGWSVIDLCARHLTLMSGRVSPAPRTERRIPPHQPHSRTRYGVWRDDWRPVKWDYLPPEERALLERTPLACADGSPLLCSVCGTTLETEAEFAQHFVVGDVRLLNLGNCPNGRTRGPA